MKYRTLFALFVFTLWASQATLASAQGQTARLAPPVMVDATTAELAPISPATSPGPLSLDACIDLGFQHQPALAAARASLSAAYSGKRSVDRMIIPRLFAKDLPVRRQQACQGVVIADAGLTQAEWETRYAITRNFFTVQYIRSQEKVVDDVLASLVRGHKRASELFGKGNADFKITQIDLDMLTVQIEIVQGKKAQVRNGMKKAEAALLEAMGLGHDYPLEVAVVDLPQAVYAKKTMVDAVKDDKGKMVKVKVELVEWKQLYKFNRNDLVAAALANRGEIIQANAANRVVNLEIEAQAYIRGWQGRTFAQGGDIHVQPVPQGSSNGYYKPGAFSIEMPAMLAGRKRDREDRARDLAQRAAAVVDKAENLVALDVVAQYLNWQEAVEDIQGLKKIYDIAQQMPGKVEQLVGNKDLTSAAIIQANMTAIQVRTQLNDEMHIHALALAGLERATAGAFRVYPVPAAPMVMPK